MRHNASLSRWRGLLSTNGFSVCRARRKISFLDSHRHRSFTVHGGGRVLLGVGGLLIAWGFTERVVL